MRPISVTLLILALSSVITLRAHAENRLALVIGNASYKHAPLANPKNDATLMADTLERLGFKVTRLIDADQTTIKRAMIDFGRQLRGSDSVGLFYYAGHGVQVEGENFLIPIGAVIDDELEVSIEAVSVNEFLRTMKRASSRINIVVLDACRNNPYARSFRSHVRGLARVDAPKGTYVAYATSPGAIALDGKTGHSPYTKALSKAMLSPGLPIEQVFKQARREVLRATNDKQTPWETSSITGRFYFTPPVTNVAAQLSKPGPNDSTMELAYWETIKGSDNPAFFKSYLRRFPTGVFSELARAMIEQLENNRSDPETSSVPETVGSRDGESQREQLYWDAVKDSEDPLLLDAYLRKYPDGRFAERATVMIERLTQADEDARNQQNVAAIEPEITDVPLPSEEDRPDSDLPLQIQAALSNVGCDPGTVDGRWGRKSSAALGRFAKYAGIDLPAPEVSAETLALLENETGRVCPPGCRAGEVLSGEKCVAAKRKRRAVRKSRRVRRGPFGWKVRKPKGTQRANGGTCALASQCGREN